MAQYIGEKLDYSIYFLQNSRQKAEKNCFPNVMKKKERQKVHPKRI
jgi:hypothetical protein